MMHSHSIRTALVEKETDSLREQLIRQNGMNRILRERLDLAEERLLEYQQRNQNEQKLRTNELRQYEQRALDAERQLRTAQLQMTSGEQIRTQLYDTIRRICIIFGLDVGTPHIDMLQELTKFKTRLTAHSTNELELRNECERLQYDKNAADRQLHDIQIDLERTKCEQKYAETKCATNEEDLIKIRKDESKLQDELKVRDDELEHCRNELKSLNITTELKIHEKIHDLVNENQRKTLELERYQNEHNQNAIRLRLLAEEKSQLEIAHKKLDLELYQIKQNRDHLKREQLTFQGFLHRLANIMNLEEISADIGMDLSTESLVLRAEQLAKSEGDKMLDKTSHVYQLQKRLKTQKEQLQRKDLHLELLKRKLNLQEEGIKGRYAMETERNEANGRIRKLIKQLDGLEIKLSEANGQIAEMSTQLAAATDYKITALERGRKIDDLQKRLIDSEMLRTRYTRKMTQLKEQIRTTGDTIEAERNISEQSRQMLRDENERLKRRLHHLEEFKAAVLRCLNFIDGPNLSVFEVCQKLEKLISAHREFSLLSRRYNNTNCVKFDLSTTNFNDEL